MPITPSIERWLYQAGYENHCFISWPHTQNKEITDCARQIKQAIESKLAALVPTPSVFLDETGITAGDIWPEVLRRALCKSIAMVAICAPIYYHPSHEWCGLEWAAMDSLSAQRLPGAQFKAIIPVMVRKSELLPAAVSGGQYIDASRVMISGRHYFGTREFHLKVEEIVQKIERIAEAIAQNQAVTNCDRFQFPTESAFLDYAAQAQPFPFRS
jgi:hypothetical protein